VHSVYSMSLHLGSCVLFSCIFSSNTCAHIFRPALVKFVRKIPYTSVWPLYLLYFYARFDSQNWFVTSVNRYVAGLRKEKGVEEKIRHGLFGPTKTTQARTIRGLLADHPPLKI
jgi:hypothetical protein